MGIRCCTPAQRAKSAGMGVLPVADSTHKCNSVGNDYARYFMTMIRKIILVIFGVLGAFSVFIFPETPFDMYSKINWPGYLSFMPLLIWPAVAFAPFIFDRRMRILKARGLIDKSEIVYRIYVFEYKFTSFICIAFGVSRAVVRAFDGQLDFMGFLFVLFGLSRLLVWHWQKNSN